MLKKYPSIQKCAQQSNHNKNKNQVMRSPRFGRELRSKMIP
jgi:hypothetical protein